MRKSILPGGRSVVNSSSMSTLGYPDRHFVSAALGWLDLRAPEEARAELSRISAGNACHSEVLELWWRVHAAKRHWSEALRVAEMELVAAPDRLSGWVDRSYSLHELRRTQEAHEALLPAVKRFPETSLIPYNLACYACQLGQPAEARQWLVKAIAQGDRDDIKRLALNDPDLAELHEEILKL